MKDTEMNELDDELKTAVSQGIISLEDVRKLMEQKERTKILAQHTYKIFFAEKEQRWKTMVPDETKKNGRRLIAKKKREDLEEALIDFYRQQELVEDKKQPSVVDVPPQVTVTNASKPPVSEVESKVPTLREFFPEWLEYKNLRIAASSYLRRIMNDWNKYYLNDEIIDIPLDQLDYLTLDRWAYSLIRRNNMTTKQYYNMSLILRQSMAYALERGLIEENPFSRVQISSKIFVKKVKPRDETQVFSEEDENAICKLALEKYYKRPTSICGLAIALNFQLGLRVGELVALKWDDITDNYIHIQRMEAMQYTLDGTKVIRQGAMVVNHTKSAAGDRRLYLTEEARRILEIVKKRSEEYGFYDEGYIFVSNRRRRIKTQKIIDCLYQLCDEVNCDRKSSHKIRKTYVSSLFDTGMNINKIREIAGHEDERTSLHNYCFNRKSSADIEKILENNSANRKFVS